MKFLLVFITLIAHFNAFANNIKEPQKTDETTQDAQKIKMLILDKLYANRNFYDINIGQKIKVDDLEIHAKSCIENAEMQQFAFLEIAQNGDTILNQWVPILKHNATPISHKRFDVAVLSCNFYTQKN